MKHGSPTCPLGGCGGECVYLYSSHDLAVVWVWCIFCVKHELSNMSIGRSRAVLATTSGLQSGPVGRADESYEDDIVVVGVR